MNCKVRWPPDLRHRRAQLDPLFTCRPNNLRVALAQWCFDAIPPFVGFADSMIPFAFHRPAHRAALPPHRWPSAGKALTTLN